MKKNIKMGKLLSTFLFFVFTFIGQVLSMQEVTQQINPGKIILLNGTSSAGKTSIAYAMSDLLTSQGDEVEVVEVDKVQSELLLQRAIDRGYSVPTNISDRDEKVYDAFDKGFLNGSEIDFNVLYPEVFNKSIEITNAFAAQGKIVIVDIVADNINALNSFLSGVEHFKVFKVLVYASPSCILDHVIARNSLERTTLKRPPIQAFCQFLKFYESQKTPNEGIALQGGFCQKEWTDIFIELRSAAVFEADDFDEILAMLGEFNKLFVERFNLLNPSSVTTITTTLPCDFLVNSGTASPKECAEKIMSVF